jgi:hypothetical protein
VLISAALAMLCMPVLEIGTGGDSPLRFPLGPEARFSVTYWHSMAAHCAW